MSASTISRSKDYSQDQTNNTGGRAAVDTAGLDGEIDDIVAALANHATRIDLLVRDDLLLKDDMILGHELSAAALRLIAAYVGATGVLVWQGDWGTSTPYIIGDLVAYSGNAYICVTAHTSGTFATDLGAGDWELFAAGSLSLPSQSGHADEVLMSDGAAESWGKVSSAHVDSTIAPSAAPTFTGKTKDDGSVLTGKTTGSITSGAPSFAIDFDGKAHQVLSIENNATFTTSNRAAASNEVKVVDLILTADGSGPYTLTFPGTWRWVTAIPASIAASKKAVLSLRCVGTADADVVAAFAVEG